MMLIVALFCGSQMALAQSFPNGYYGWSRMGEFEGPNKTVSIEREVKKSPSLGTRILDACNIFIEPRSNFKKLIKKRLELLGYQVVENKAGARFLVSAELSFLLKDTLDHSEQYLFQGVAREIVGYSRHPRKYQVGVSRSDVNTWLKHDFPQCKEL